MIRFDDNVKKWIFLISGISCFLLVFGIVTVFKGAFANVEEIVPSAVAEVEGSLPADAVSDAWAVYVTGEVAFPGVYEIKPGSRVRDAVEMAGGFTRKADGEAVNLAAKLRDEAHITVPAINEANPAETNPPKTDLTNEKPITAISYPAAKASEKSDSLVNINTAGANELSTLPGIGPKLSAAIVAYRDENGPFANVDDLRSVRGIGEKRMETLRELVKVSD